MKYITILFISLIASTYSLSNNENFDPSVLCPIVETFEQQLCKQSTSPPIKLCGLLEFYNEGFCGNYNNFEPSQLCPLVEMIDQELCQSNDKYDTGIDPSEFCPLFELFDQKVCQH